MNTVHGETSRTGLHDVAMWPIHDGWRYANYRKLFEGIALRLVALDVPPQPAHEIAYPKAPLGRRLTGTDALFDYPPLYELRAAGQASVEFEIAVHGGEVLSREIRHFWLQYCEPATRRRLRGIARETEIFALRPQALRSSAAPAK